MATEASLEGWGAQIGIEDTGGRWLPSESDEHINVLELKAILLGLHSLAKVRNTHIKLFTDNNSFSVREKNGGGGTWSPRCNEITKLIWQWAEDRNIWLTINYIPSKDNIVPGRRSSVNLVTI